VYRVFARPLLVCAAIVGAAIVIVDAFPRVDRTFRWRETEYEKLSSIHAGYNVAFVEERLGVPAQTEILGRTAFVQRTFVRRDHFVHVVSDRSDRVVLFSVTSCDPGFQPEFEPFRDVNLRLQDKALMNEPVSKRQGMGTEIFRENNRILGYQVGVSVSTPEFYWEWTGPNSNATGLRSFFVGVNPLCLSPEQLHQVPAASYTGSPVDAPADVKGFRAKFAANMYAETVALTPVVDDLGLVVVAAGLTAETTCRASPIKADCALTTVGTFSFSLPSGYNGRTAQADD
jgi:hypothetical protein